MGSETPSTTPGGPLVSRAYQGAAYSGAAYMTLGYLAAMCLLVTLYRLLPGLPTTGLAQCAAMPLAFMGVHRLINRLVGGAESLDRSNAGLIALAVLLGVALLMWAPTVAASASGVFFAFALGSLAFFGVSCVRARGLKPFLLGALISVPVFLAEYQGGYLTLFDGLADSGLGHRDTYLHLSLMRSFLDRGYPSLDYHGASFFAYHTLSMAWGAGYSLLAQVRPETLISHIHTLIFTPIAIYGLALFPARPWRQIRQLLLAATIGLVLFYAHLIQSLSANFAVMLFVYFWPGLKAVTALDGGQFQRFRVLWICGLLGLSVAALTLGKISFGIIAAGLLVYLGLRSLILGRFLAAGALFLPGILGVALAAPLAFSFVRYDGAVAATPIADYSFILTKFIWLLAPFFWVLVIDLWRLASVRDGDWWDRLTGYSGSSQWLLALTVGAAFLGVPFANNTSDIIYLFSPFLAILFSEALAFGGAARLFPVALAESLDPWRTGWRGRIAKVLCLVALIAAFIHPMNKGISKSLLFREREQFRAHIAANDVCGPNMGAWACRLAKIQTYLGGYVPVAIEAQYATGLIREIARHRVHDDTTALWIPAGHPYWWEVSELEAQLIPLALSSYTLVFAGRYAPYQSFGDGPLAAEGLRPDTQADRMAVCLEAVRLGLGDVKIAVGNRLDTLDCDAG